MQRQFELEREMTTPAARWLREAGLLVRTEYPTSLGICDLVGLSFDAAAGRDRLRLRQRVPITDVRKLALLNEIPPAESARSTDIDRLRKAASGLLDIGDPVAGTAWLLKHGYIVATAGGSYQRRTTSKPLELRIVAVELKLSRVDEAVRQARARLAFATESVVGFPADLARSIAASCPHRLTSAGIGLLAVSRDGCELLIRPRPAVASSNPLMRAQCLERFWPEFKRVLSA